MSQNEERWKNFMLFNMFATNDEVAEMTPWFSLIAVILLVCVFFFHGCENKKQPEPTKNKGVVAYHEAF